ncbi:TlpA disulfide reductase family protein [Leucobacter luti]|uniref:Thiol-disulfide isomerase/thioredoxin n=1 Tax=Leucobacter luti TaxID=340320 RepID=A0A4Q7TZK3_9MICO|nr:TlpA disulfide reductase family protein [Leucobacter luti]MBL3699089.1 TlpA family protein disulfide reductase [Leucobacter luti]RZT66591.1 thiol-disulfide isomerase/thioredoxin [Leucobacter luti]
MTAKRISAAVALGLAAALTLAGCSGAGNDLAQQWQESNEKGYISGDGTSASFLPSERTDPVEFSGTVENGDTFASTDTLGKVTVVNFWYAGCAPCRAEAPDLVAAYDEFAGDDVAFLGVNTRDQVAQAQQFAEEFGVEYPSIMDMPGGRSVQRAFAGEVPLNAVPTTLILDREGRVAHRVLGQLAAESQLTTLIKETLAEDGGAAAAESDADPGDTAGRAE